MSNVAEKPTSTTGFTCFWTVWTVVLCIAGGLEVRRLIQMLDEKLGFVTWLLYWDMETTLPVIVMLTLPLLLFVYRNRRLRKASNALHSVDSARPEIERSVSRMAVISSCLLLFSISLTGSWRIGSESLNVTAGAASQSVAFADLPPAYHDEYSYLLQARTNENGRLSWPKMSVRPDLFHQFHVLNEHRTVSRYFPWTGMWMAPFHQAGVAVWGHWIAGGLSAAILFLALIQVATLPRAFVGGLLVAVSPGIAVFSNLLLAHHPTMLALSIFMCAFFRMTKTGSMRWAFVAGIALTLAMLGRPMTAAGFALPFGIHLLSRSFRDRGQLRLLIGFAVPLICGFIFLGLMNHAATGSWSRTAYQEYTNRFTPRHRYGFGNGTESPAEHASPAVRAYDNWASNLTAARAARNVWLRTLASFQWSLAIFPLAFFLAIAVPGLRSNETAEREPDEVADSSRSWDRKRLLRLLPWSILTLHAAHIPYWFDGIMHWHYVFETAPLLLLLAGIGCVNSVLLLKQRLPTKVATLWVASLVVAGLLPGWFELGVYSDTSKIGAAISEQSYSRARFFFFNETVAGPKIRKPALILVDEAGTDPQLSYIINDPLLSGTVIVCRQPESPDEVTELRHAFPERHLYSFDPGTMTFAALPPSN